MATYYVNNITGDDGDSGLTEELAKATIAGAIAIMVAGDTCYIKATGTIYGEIINPQMTSQYLTTSFIGYKTVIDDADTHLGDADYRPVIQGFVANNEDYCNYVVKHLSAFYAGFFVNYDSLNVTFYNCYSTNANYGFYLNQWATCIKCEAAENEGPGFLASTGSSLIDCVSHDNENPGGNPIAQITADSYSLVCRCRVYGFPAEGGTGIDITGQRVVVINNSIDGGGYASIGINAYEPGSIVANNIVYNCGVGIAGRGVGPGGVINGNGSTYGDYNCINLNTQPYTHWTAGTNDVSSTIQPFYSAYNKDYRLKQASKCRQAGIGGEDIGAINTNYNNAQITNIGSQI